MQGLLHSRVVEPFFDDGRLDTRPGSLCAQELPPICLETALGQHDPWWMVPTLWHCRPVLPCACLPGVGERSCCHFHGTPCAVRQDRDPSPLTLHFLDGA